MSRGNGLTGDKNFEHSTEYFEIGKRSRRIAYGKTREEVLEEIGRTDPRSNWMDHWVVMSTRTIRLGLGPQWARVTRRYDKAYHMI